MDELYRWQKADDFPKDTMIDVDYDAEYDMYTIELEHKHKPVLLCLSVSGSVANHLDGTVLKAMRAELISTFNKAVAEDESGGE